MAVFKVYKFISCTEIICVEMVPFLFSSTKLIALYHEKAMFFILYTKETIFLTLYTNKCSKFHTYRIELKSGDKAETSLSASVESQQANN